jgi:DNA-binding Lrp family transcriptional regulator
MDIKIKILKVLNQSYPKDLSIQEISKKIGVSHWTTSLYIKVLVAEKKIKFERMIGRAKLFRLKK